MPPELRLVADPATRSYDEGRTLLGRSRLLRLTDRGARLVAEWQAGAPLGVTPVARALARRLLDAEVMQPRPAGSAYRLTDVAVVIPVRDRPGSLQRCLSALRMQEETYGDVGGASRETYRDVVVVDDGSIDAEAIQRAAERAGARVVRHPAARGPAAARNTGAAATVAPVIACCDSDTRPTPAALRGLLAHLDDPAVGIIGPRIVSVEDAQSPDASVRNRGPISGLVGRYEQVRSPLDMGGREGFAVPGRHPAYLPSTVLVIRRSAFAGFDEAFTMGEDVDLCWRTAAAVRYDPSVRVGHEHRTDPIGWLRRRFDYGSSAGALGRRHPGALAFAVLHPQPLAPLAALACGRPVLALGLGAAHAARMGRRLAPYDVPTSEITRLAGTGYATTARTLGELSVGPWLPLSVAALSRPGRARQRAAALITGTLLEEWLRRRPALDPVSFAALRLLDGAAGAAGIWWSCARERTLRPLLPRPARPRWLASRRG